MLLDYFLKIFILFAKLITECGKILFVKSFKHFFLIYAFALNLLIAFFVNSLNTSLPLLAALSNNNLSQCSVPFQNIFFISVIACGDECASVSASRCSDWSIPSIVVCTSENKPFLLAHSAFRHIVASIANALKAAVPIFLSTAGPTTNGPMPTASSLNLISADSVAIA